MTPLTRPFALRSSLRHSKRARSAVMSLVCTCAALWTPTVTPAHADMGQVYRDAERLSAPVKLQRSTKMLTEMQGSLRVALKSLKEAYDQKNVNKTSCVKNHLSTMKGLLRISEQADVSLREAVVVGQTDLIDHEFVKVSMAYERTKSTLALISTCVGDINDPLTGESQQKVITEVFDQSIQDYTASTDEQSILTYTDMEQQPTALSASE